MTSPSEPADPIGAGEPGVLDPLGGGQILFPSAPVVPPSIHPEWQGSIPSKWMDRQNGKERGLKQVYTYCRNGYDGVARQGLGAYFTDQKGNIYNEGRKHVPPPEDGVNTWPERELIWRPSKRVSCVPPNTLMKDHITRAEKLTDHLYVRRYEAAERLRMRGLLKAASEGILAQSNAAAARKGQTRAPHNGPICTESIKFGPPWQKTAEPLMSTVDALRPHRHGFTTRYQGPPALKDGEAGDGGAFELQELPTTYQHPNAWCQGPNPPTRIQLFPEPLKALKRSESVPAGSLSRADQREVQLVKEAEEWERRVGVGPRNRGTDSRPFASGEAIAVGGRPASVTARSGIPVPSPISVPVL